MSKAANRLTSQTVDIELGATPTSVGHLLSVSLAFETPGGPLREVVFVSRGKIGGGTDAMFHELGIKLSRAIQGRDPETGEVSKP